MDFEKYPNWAEVYGYAMDIVEGRKIACKETKQMAERFLRDLENPAYEMRPRDAEIAIIIVERTLRHSQGESVAGEPMRGKPLELMTWHKFAVYNLLGFYHAGTNLRRFHEAFIMVPRKNVKTTFVAALAWAISIVNRASGSKCYVVGAALKQALESFNFLAYNIRIPERLSSTA